MTAVSSFACLVTTPIVLSLLIGNYMPGEFDMPAAKIALEITLILMLPLVLTVLIDLTVAIGVGVALGLALRLSRRASVESDWTPPER